MENKAKENPSEDIQKLGKLIKGIRVAMLTTVQEDGSLHCRPMATQEVDFDGDLWFFTSASSPKISEIKHDQHVNVAYASPEDNRYVSVCGRVEIVRDRKKAEELWSPYVKGWFPKGPDDPDLVLLKVKVLWAEYWDSPHATAVRLAGFLKATLTGKPLESPGDTGTINLQDKK